jgi:Cd2+/Zn2+-exporting ATPase
VVRETKGIRTTAEFRVHGLDCAEEILVIRKQLGREQGIHELNFDVVRGKMVVDFDSARVRPAQIQKSVTETGLKCEPWMELAERDQTLFERHGKVALAAISGASLIAAMIWRGFTTGDFLTALLAHEHTRGHHMSTPVLGLCLIAIATGAWFILPKAAFSIRRLQPDMNALVVVSLMGAAYLGEWIEGATLSFLFALAALLETYSLARARNAVTALMQFAPGEASVVHGSHEHKVPVSHLKVGALVRVRAGERIPCDGEVVSGASDVNQAMITGEALPAHKGAGDSVYAGTMNGDGTLDVRATRAASDTTLARIVRMVEGVQHRRAPSEQFVEKFSRIYTPAMMLLALLVAVTPPLLMGKDWGHWFYQGMVILLISCPCALVISTPVSIVAALASAARQGVLVKGGAFLEEAARLRAVAFDKTGVLTTGEPEVRSIVPLNGFTREQVLARLAALEAQSSHPMARAIARYAKEQGIAAAPIGNFQTIQGKGAQAEIGGEKFWVGSLRLMREMGLDAQDVVAQLDGANPASIVACGTDRQAWAVILIADSARPDAREAIAELRRQGIESVTMLTGDNRAAAEQIGKQVGVDDVRAELLPDDKAVAVAGLKQTYGQVAMVGDGVNDAQAMAASSLGVSMALAGMDVVMETADVILISGGLRKLGFLLRHARRTAGVIKQNIGIALALKGVFLVLAFFGLATLWLAVAADMGATLLVTLNGLRLLRARA